jgi:hypothetical protein
VNKQLQGIECAGSQENNRKCKNTAVWKCEGWRSSYGSPGTSYHCNDCKIWIEKHYDPRVFKIMEYNMFEPVFFPLDVCAVCLNVYNFEHKLGMELICPECEKKESGIEVEVKIVKECHRCNRKANLWVCDECGQSFCGDCITGLYCKDCTEIWDNLQAQEKQPEPVKTGNKIIEKWFSIGYEQGMKDMARKMSFFSHPHHPITKNIISIPDRQRLGVIEDYAMRMIRDKNPDFKLFLRNALRSLRRKK